MWVKPLTIAKFDWGLNLSTTSEIGDNQFQVAKNVYYNSKWQIQTRYGIDYFGNALWTDKPVHSYFFFQRDDNLETTALAVSETDIYKYTESTGNRASISATVSEFETLPGKTTERVRFDFAVYKNVIYMCNGVDAYQKYDGTTRSEIGMWSPVVCTFTNWTDLVNKVWHWLENWDSVRFSNSWGALPAEIVDWQFYYVVNKNTDDFQISETYDWDALDFTDDWTGTNSYELAGQPRYRYINMNTDRLYGTGADATPTTLYYTNAAPANWNDLTTNVVVVGWDELGRINGMNELWNIILVMKSWKIYSVDVTNTKAEAIDAQTWWYSDRSIANVANSLVYLTERGIDTLKPRTWVTGSSALESTQLDENVRELTRQIEENQYNANAWWYVKKLNNYYFAFDTNGDNVPDTVLVYNALVKAWTQYIYPNLYDFWSYIDSDWVHYFLGASATEDRIYELETGTQDLWEDIEFELKSKDYDFWEPGTYKTYWYIDITGQKSKYFDIELNIEVDWEIVWWGKITDDNITQTAVKETLWTRAIWVDTLTWESDSPTDVYNFVARIPLYVTGTNINFQLKSTGGTWILHKARIDVNKESIDVFGYSNII